MIDTSSRRQRSLRMIFTGAVIICFLTGVQFRTAPAQSSPVPEGATIEKIADGFQFTEGPIWYRQKLLFTDIPANCVVRWSPDQPPETFLKPSGHANGLAVDPDGQLVLAQHDGRVARLSPKQELETVVETYNGRRLNSPNDLTISHDGTIFFTDPPYGVDESERELNFSGVYRVDPDGSLYIVTRSLTRPNGIVLSPDEETLYVNDSSNNHVYEFTLGHDGDYDERTRFARPDDDAGPGPVDGMTVDETGRVYTTGPGGVWIYSSDGRRLDHITVPERATNITFGGPDHRTLFITAASRVFRIRLNTPGARRKN